MDIERALLATPPTNWRTARAIVFDWHDGPRQGLCRLESPPVEFAFRLLAERPSADDLDDRLFRIEELPVGSVERAESALKQLSQPTGPVWVPVWRFDSEQAGKEAEAALQAIERQGRPTDIIIQTRDLATFLGPWRAKAEARRTA